MAKQMKNRLFRVHEDSSILCTWSTGIYTLYIIYDVNKPHLSSSFSIHSKEKLKDYINNNVYEAFISAIDKIEEGCFQLNVASNSHYYGIAGESVYTKMLDVFMPIIQKFMVDALTDNLYIIEDDILVKQ